MKYKIKEIVQRMFLHINILAMNMLFGITVFAKEDEKKESGNKLMDASWFKNIMLLINDFKELLIAFEAGVVIVLLIKTKIEQQDADEDQKPMFKKKFKSIIYDGIFIMLLSGIIPTVYSYFNG